MIKASKIKTIDFKMTDSEKVKLIDHFHECYYNTPQDENLFAKEFMAVTRSILTNKIPYELEYLVDFIEGIFDVVFHNDIHEMLILAFGEHLLS